MYELIQLSSLRKGLVLVLLVLILASCASVKTPMPLTGSKADGTVTLAYDYGEFEIPRVNWDQADIEAQKSCSAWSYHHAKRFSLGETVCRNSDCSAAMVKVVYQCS